MNQRQIKTPKLTRLNPRRPADDSLQELLAAAVKTKAFIDDLSQSNPGFLGKLALQDYQQYNEAMIELPRAIAKAKKKVTP